MSDVGIYLGSNSGFLQSIIPALTGLFGALIGAAAALGSSVINHRLTIKKELANLRRSKGEDILADLAELVTWGTKAITDALDGNYAFGYPPNIFRLDASVRLYFSKHTALIVQIFKESVGLSSFVVHAALEIKRTPESTKEKTAEMLAKMKLMVELTEKLKKEVVDELHYEPENKSDKSKINKQARKA